jgi:hypothetical protein
MTKIQKKYLFALLIIIFSIITFIVLFILFKPNSTYTPITPGITSIGINLDNLSLKTDPSSSTFPANWPLTKTPITSLRTYFISPQSLKWLRYLTLNNVDVFIGLQSIDTIKLLIDELKTWTPVQLNHILAYSVANEITDVDLMINTATALKTALISVKGAIKPVTACLTFTPDWISGGKFTEPAIKLFKVLDPIICFNIYGLFFSEKQTSNRDMSLLNKALSWSESDGSIVFNNFKSVKSAMNDAGLSDHKFWVTEVGWGSAPFSFINYHWANMENAKKFYINFLKVEKQDASPDRIFWFCMRDDNNESFGLYTGQIPNLVSKFN